MAADRPGSESYGRRDSGAATFRDARFDSETGRAIEVTHTTMSSRTSSGTTEIRTWGYLELRAWPIVPDERITDCEQIFRALANLRRREQIVLQDQAGAGANVDLLRK